MLLGSEKTVYRLPFTVCYCAQAHEGWHSKKAKSTQSSSHWSRQHTSDRSQTQSTHSPSSQLGFACAEQQSVPVPSVGVAVGVPATAVGVAAGGVGVPGPTVWEAVAVGAREVGVEEATGDGLSVPLLAGVAVATTLQPRTDASTAAMSSSTLTEEL